MNEAQARAKSIVGQLLTINSVTERAAFLERACGGDASLMAEVASLVAAHGQAGDFLKQPAAAVNSAIPAPSPVPPSLVPTAAKTWPAVPPELRDHKEYEVLRELGRGGMGVVYLAKNKLMDRLEVLKVVNQQFLDQPGAVERFLREIRSAARLNHPNIVTAYAAQQLGTLLVFAMEYVDGEDLARVVGRGPLPVANACHYVRQAALGLQHAFEKGMIHRDIKPSNLMLAREGKKHTVKILDFGLAKVTRENEATGHGLTGVGKMMGTPDYMAPEQIRDAATADIRADIYSLGCTLHFLLTGEPPFQATNLYGLLQAHQSVMPTPVNQLRPDVPPELAALVAKMMAKDPAQRYQQPAEVAQALAPFLKLAAKPAIEKSVGAAISRQATVSGVTTSDVEAAQPGSQTVMPVGHATMREAQGTIPASAEPARPRPERKRLLVVGIGLALLLIGAVILWASGVFRGKPAEGILEITVNEPNAEVLVDGDRVAVNWGEGGKKAEIRLRPGSHKVEVKKDGFTASGDTVVIEEGQQRLLTVALTAVKGEVPQVLATVRHHVGKKPGAGTMHTLYSNGRVDGPDSDITWERRGDRLIFRFRNRKAPGGMEVDTCTIGTDGKTYTGRTNANHPIWGDSATNLRKLPER